MKKRFMLLSLLVLSGTNLVYPQDPLSLPYPNSRISEISNRDPQPPTPLPSPFPMGEGPGAGERMDWWRDARFGMFIHWGLYAVPAGEWNGKTGYGEWIRTSAQIPLEVYNRFVPKFNPVEFNADDWVRTAKEAGMKYIVITSKHHDGFCMFDTKQTDFNIMSTPFGRDPMKELAAACRKYGLKFCFYYSIMDWHHPDYLPRRDWEKDRSTAGADFDRYVAYMKAELKELLANYGDIGVLWFDGEWENTWNEQRGKDLYTYVRSLQPQIIVNNRVGAGRLDMEGLTKEGDFGGDFGTPEQQVPATGLPGVDWETCMTMNDHWGYNKTDKNFKSAKELIRTLTDIASKGGNFLLNVGPTAQGLFPQESIDRLAAIGEWMAVNGEAIYGTQASPFRHLDWGLCTRKQSASGTTLYLHVFDWPADGVLVLPGVLNEPVGARLLADPGRNPLHIARNQDALQISLPGASPDTINSVVVLELKGPLDMTEPPVFMNDLDIFIDTVRVVLSSDRENVEIRYEKGKTEPTVASVLYTGPVLLANTTVVSARCFRGGKPVSGTVYGEFKKVAPLDPVRVQDPDGVDHPDRVGLHYRYYEGEWDSLPDFDKLHPVREGVVPDFVFSPRNQDERFAFVYEALVRIPVTNVYTFFTDSDDGSRLWIDGGLVVDNDGLHGMQVKQGDIPLAKGFHRLRVAYFEKTGGDALVVSVKSQGSSKKTLPKNWLFVE